MIQSHSTFPARKPAARSAFTLVELLVVIGIIALISGLLLVAVTRTRSHATSARVLADLQAISAALEIYRSDLGDYPPSDSATMSGGELLAWAMVGPYNAAQGALAAKDGNDGPGFRVGFRGSVYGPYLEPEKFLLKNGNSYFLKDAQNQPILYFRRVAAPANNTPAALYNVADNAAVGVSVGALNRSPSTGVTAQDRFNAVAARSTIPLPGGTQSTFTGPYLLWSAGLDSAFGPENPLNDPDPDKAAIAAQQVKSCDDVLFSGGQ